MGFRALLVGPCVSRAEASRLRARLAGLGPFDGVIAVDGGVRSCRLLAVEPTFAIGDWDSLGHAPRTIPQITLPRDKDWSDLSVACEAAFGAGAEELVIVGVTGGRPDQHLATILDLSTFVGRRQAPERVSVVDLSATYHFLAAGLASRSRRGGGRGSSPGTLELKTRRGQIVSVFAMSGSARGVTLDGFAYPLRDAVLEPSSHGMSNRALRSEVRISLERGTLVIMVLE